MGASLLRMDEPARCDRVAVMKNGPRIGMEKAEDVAGGDIAPMILPGRNPLRGK